jgi:hypothetical protein
MGMIGEIDKNGITQDGKFKREYLSSRFRCKRCGWLLHMMDSGDWGWCFNHERPIAYCMFYPQKRKH